MSEQKTEQRQIEEMETIAHNNAPISFDSATKISLALYAAGYCKRSDVAREIISKAFERIFPTSEYDGIELIGILREVAAEIGAEVKK